MAMFSTDCTVPPPTSPIFVSSPNIRGTLAILLPCLTTLLLCTWTIQHPNIRKKRPSSWQDHVIVIGDKVFKMLWTIVSPEYLLWSATGDWAYARKLTELMGKKVEVEGASWSTTHSFFAGMRGFQYIFEGLDAGPKYIDAPVATQEVLNTRSQISREINSPSHSVSEDYEKGPETLVSSTSVPFPQSNRKPKKVRQQMILNYLDARESSLSQRDHPNTILAQSALSWIRTEMLYGTLPYSGGVTAIIDSIVRLSGPTWTLDGAQLMLARQMGIISHFPTITNEEIEDRSSSDSLAKFLAVFQALWQIVQLLIRFANHMPSSQIEVVTVAFSLCAICVYGLYWYKPQDAKSPFVSKAARYATREEMLQLAYIGRRFDASTLNPNLTQMSELKNVYEQQYIDCGTLRLLGATSIGILFGLIHLAAWNFHFPTQVESLLWRIASLVSVGIPALYLLAAVPGKVVKIYTKLLTKCGLLIMVVYVICRLYLLVETVRSLAYLEPDVFVDVMPW